MRTRRIRRRSLFVVVLAAAMALCGAIVPSSAGADTATDLLPNVFPVTDSRGLADNDLARDPTGTMWLRYAGTTGNVGAGPLDIVGLRPSASPQTVEINNDSMPAFQRIHRTDGSVRLVQVGTLEYDPTFMHWTLADIAQYHLINSSGVEVRTGQKLYYCLADVIRVSDPALPGQPQGAGAFGACVHDAYATNLDMGISVGWADVYSKDLIGQSFDVTDLMKLPAQQYALRMTTNPLGNVIDTNHGPVSGDVTVTIGQGVPFKTWGGPRPGV